MYEISGLDKNPKLGYYKVGDKIFYSKPQAFMYATEVNRWPEWKFNLNTYASLDWTQEPETNIRELYRMRAQQIRDKYDYVRLECSGGSDSTTVAFAFLLNGIHLDEVIFRYPKTGEKDMSNDPFNTKSENTLSEFQFAAQPLLNWIKTNFPKTTVRIHDFAENMLEQESIRDESWIFETKHWFQPAHGDKYDQFNLPEHKALLDSGKSIGVVIGIDKPRVTLIDNEWYSLFTDVHTNSSHPIVGDYTNITNELFYWSPDFPEISVKQSHMVKTWFDLPANAHLRHVVEFSNFQSVARRTAYEQVVKAIIYPDYDLETWQTSKPTNSFYNEMDTWFYKNFKETRLYTAWEAGIQLLLDKIDPKYLICEMGKPTGLITQLSPLYYLGPSKLTTNSTPGFVNRDYIQQLNMNAVGIKDKKLKTIKV